MRRPGAYLLSLALVLVALALGAVPALASGRAVITDVRVGAYHGATRIVLETSRPIPFDLFALTGPDRIVLDMPQVGWQLPARPLPSPQGVFQRLRYGLFKPGDTRVVIDLAAPAKVESAFLLGPGTESPHRIVIDLKGISPASFLRVAKLPPTSVTAASPASLQNPDEPSPEPVADAAPTPQAPAPAPKPKRRLATLLTKNQPVPHAPIAGSTLFNTSGFRLPPRKPVAPPPPSATKAERWTVVIDPGHGGKDPGTIGLGGIYEKNVVLAIGLDLRRALEKRGGFHVLMTRTRDIFIPLKDRVAFAREHHADLFVSLHANSIHDPQISGVSVYTLSQTASDGLAAELADSENKADVIQGIDLSQESPDVSNILIDLAQRETMNNSIRFASMLVRDLRASSAKVLTKTHRFAGFVVLKDPDVPSVLIETGFLSNHRDMRRLRSASYRRKLAGCIADAIQRYFTHVEQAQLK